MALTDGGDVAGSCEQSIHFGFHKILGVLD